MTIGDTSPVTAGGWIHIVQAGSDNTVILGGSGLGSPYDFETVYLDIYTGDGGGGFVSATNTAVDVGSNLGNDFVIDGGGDGNTYVQQTTPVLTWANPADITYGTALERHPARRHGQRAGDLHLHAGRWDGPGRRQQPDAVGHLHADRHDRLHHCHRNRDDQRLARRRRRSPGPTRRTSSTARP